MKQRTPMYSRAVAALLLLSVFGFTRVSAQSNGISSILTVMYQGVELQRAGTEAWIPIRRGAQMPFGDGDRVRTNNVGRVRLTFGDEADAYLLPYSMIELVEFEADNGEITQLALRLDGVVAQHFPTAPQSYTLDTGLFTLTQPSANFMVWSKIEDSSVVTVAEGEVAVTVNDQSFEVPATHGFLASSGGETIERTLAYPYNAARFVGAINGCPGRVKTPTGLNTNVRVGPGSSYTVIGSIPNGTEISVLGVVESGTWFRTQMLSGFGWLNFQMLEHECGSLPSLPDRSIEDNRNVFEASDAEFEILEPYFGPREADLWFYLMPLQ